MYKCWRWMPLEGSQLPWFNMQKMNMQLQHSTQILWCADTHVEIKLKPEKISGTYIYIPLDRYIECKKVAPPHQQGHGFCIQTAAHRSNPRQCSWEVPGKGVRGTRWSSERSGIDGQVNKLHITSWALIYFVTGWCNNGAGLGEWVRVAMEMCASGGSLPPPISYLGEYMTLSCCLFVFGSNWISVNCVGASVS